MILDQPNSNDPNMYDLSFMYTHRCDLECPFCMYNSSPEVNDAIDLGALEQWLRTVDYERIASFGVYGGEVGVDLEGFGRCFELVAGIDRPHFVITNGTWSMDKEKTERFMDFVYDHQCFMVVSGTPWHRRHQDRRVLESLQRQLPSLIRLKPREENFHAMGKLAGRMKFSCSRKCMTWDRAKRIAVQPDGTIIYQNCDGVYPVVGDLSEPFSVIDARITAMRAEGFAPVCEHFEGASS